MRMRFSIGGCLIALVLAGGCAQKLTYEHWSSIENGASPEEVAAVLGDPWQRTSDTWIYQDADRGITANIYFKDKQVIGKKWGDPQRGIEGGSPYVTQPGEEHSIRARTIE